MGRDWGTERGPGVWAVCVCVRRSSHSRSLGGAWNPGIPPSLDLMSTHDCILQGHPLTQWPPPTAAPGVHMALNRTPWGGGGAWRERPLCSASAPTGQTLPGGPRGAPSTQAPLRASEQSFGPLSSPTPTHVHRTAILGLAVEGFAGQGRPDQWPRCLGRALE